MIVSSLVKLVKSHSEGCMSKVVWLNSTTNDDRVKLPNDFCKLVPSMCFKGRCFPPKRQASGGYRGGWVGAVRSPLAVPPCRLYFFCRQASWLWLEFLCLCTLLFLCPPQAIWIQSATRCAEDAACRIGRDTISSLSHLPV